MRRFFEKIGLKSPNELVGVDIGANSIKLCTLKTGKTGLKLQKLARKFYDDDLLHDGNIIDRAFLAQELKSLIQQNGIGCRTAAAALSSYTVITKRITIPFLDEEALEKSVKLEVESVIPFPLRDIYYNYYVMGVDEEKEGMMNLLIVAAKKEIVEGYIKVFELAGLNLVILDVDVFAITNLVETIYAPRDFSVVVADVGASVTNIAIMKKENIEFTREILIGGRYLTYEIAKAQKLEVGEAEEKKMKAEPELLFLFDDFSGNVSSEINKTVNFYVATKPREQVGRIYLTGGSSLVPGLKERIEKETGIEVIFLDPFLMLGERSPTEGSDDHLGYFMPVALYLSSRIGDLAL